ncbi:unnamed protein product, partial [Didymodactylos carnosus]
IMNTVVDTTTFINSAGTSSLPETVNYDVLKNILTRQRHTLVKDVREGYSFLNLKKAIETYNEHVSQSSSSSERFNFYTDVIPQLAKWATDNDQSKRVQPLQAGIPEKITYTISQALSNSGYETLGYGNVDLIDSYEKVNRTGQERLLCLLSYFHQSIEEQSDERKVTIERYDANVTIPDWSTQNMVIHSSIVNVFTDRIENAQDAHAFVDFANNDIHIHCIVPSCTQEEILFNCCPEAFLSILVCETLMDNEVVVIRVMDACFEEQFSRDMIKQDLGKAYRAFSSQTGKMITGNWGCGAFGGDFVHKFLQQVCVAIVLQGKVSLCYSYAIPVS